MLFCFQKFLDFYGVPWYLNQQSQNNAGKGRKLDWEFFILLLGCLYLLALIAFLVFLKRIPRVWRLAAYGAFCAVLIFVAWGFHSLQILGRNISAGLRALEFFKALQAQLASGNFAEGLLELPGVGSGILLSLPAAAAIFGGAVCCWLKIRWYSYLILPAVLILASFLFAYPDALDQRQDVEEHNALRRQTYALVAEKRAQGVTGRQMAELIGAKLKDFRYSYENRRGEKESVARILSALWALTPQEEI